MNGEWGLLVLKCEEWIGACKSKWTVVVDFHEWLEKIDHTRWDCTVPAAQLAINGRFVSTDQC